MNIYVGANEFHDVIVVFVKRIPLDGRRRVLLSRKRRFTRSPFLRCNSSRNKPKKKKNARPLTPLFSRLVKRVFRLRSFFRFRHDHTSGPVDRPGRSDTD